MLQLATLGCAGVNLHGGRSAFLIAGLGGHTPGMTVATKPQAVHSGFYSPIQSEPGGEVKATPVFYGMMLANQLAGAGMLRSQCDLQRVNATIYAARRDDEVRVAIFNKDELTSIQLAVRSSFQISTATVQRMQGPALTATEGVTLAGVQILPHAQWSPRAAKPAAVRNSIARLRVPNASAALLILK